MGITNNYNVTKLAARSFTFCLAVLMVVEPVVGQSRVFPYYGHASARVVLASSKTTKKKTASKAKATAKRSTRPETSARTARMQSAFVASSELRPMAQQLTALRTPAAYAGVAAYAQNHKGDAASAAYLALGYSYLQDKRYSEAVSNLRMARQNGQALADYIDYFEAQADHGGNNDAAAVSLLHGFAARYPDSIFDAEIPELEAVTILGTGNAAGAKQVLDQVAGSASAGRPGFLLAQAQIAAAQGQTNAAATLYKRLLVSKPLSTEAATARTKLASMGMESTLSVAELRSLGDAYYNAGRYADASEQYRALIKQAGLSASVRNGFAVAAAACDMKLKRLTVAQAEALADTKDENGARRLYILAELARNRTDLAEQKRIVERMETDFPQSSWLAEALFSAANTYMLRRENSTAIEYYSYLAAHFPANKNAALAHWKAGWLSYRMAQYNNAARLFEEQIKLYPKDTETASALYWRARIYENQERKPALAATNYHTIIRVYPHYFYAQMSRRRLAALGGSQAGTQSQMDGFQPLQVPQLNDSFPLNSVHLAKARLLANAGLNDYIPREIAADPDSSSWSALAEAQIYSSYGEHYRAMRALKKAMPYAASAPIKSVPMAYWRILFPKAWWDTIKAESAKNNLDPYLVASLIREESEFNPRVVSYANAYGLMQLLPSVGKSVAKDEGMGRIETYQLFDPSTNIRLGTRYLRQLMDKVGGVPEYALAAYNAGDSRVTDWLAAGPYSGIDEFVESIPFTQTREYVQGILRNEEIYKSIDAAANTQAFGGGSTSR